MEQSNASLQQKVKGLRSGIAKVRRSKEARREDGSSHSDVEMTTKKSETVIQDIVSKEIIVAMQEKSTLAKGVFVGTRYFGDSEQPHVKATSGHTYTYFGVPNHVAPCSQVTKHEIRKRSQRVNYFASQLSGSACDEERGLLYADLILTNKSLFRGCLEEAGFQLLSRITPEDAVALQTLLRMTRSSFRNLRLCLSNLDANILPSEGQTEKEKKPMASHWLLIWTRKL